MNPYRKRILETISAVLRPAGRIPSALDVGSGDGWFAQQLRLAGLAGVVTPIDIFRRKQVLVEPIIYDGMSIPFEDRSFDLVYAIDVLHHCADPVAQIRESLRCSRRYFLLKDHTYSARWEYWQLAVLDEIGNKRFGVPSPYLYQRGWSWHAEIERLGWHRTAHIHPARCHRGLLGAATNRLQFVSLYEREV